MVRPNRVMAILLDGAPPADAIDKARNRNGEEIVLGAREIFVFYGEGQAEFTAADSRRRRGHGAQHDDLGRERHPVRRDRKEAAGRAQMSDARDQIGQCQQPAGDAPHDGLRWNAARNRALRAPRHNPSLP